MITFNLPEKAVVNLAWDDVRRYDLPPDNDPELQAVYLAIHNAPSKRIGKGYTRIVTCPNEKIARRMLKDLTDQADSYEMETDNDIRAEVRALRVGAERLRVSIEVHSQPA